MKASYLRTMMILLTATTLSSCATVFGGRVGECQRTRPAAGQPMREIRGAALILDVLFFPPGVLIDYATCAIYKPCQSGPENRK